jgi:hypothetical protein
MSETRLGRPEAVSRDAVAGCLLKVGQVEMDPDHPVLTRQQVRWMYLLCLQAADERGLEARLEDRRLVFATGDSMSFFNLARRLAGLDSEAEWPEFVSSALNVLLDVLAEMP